jgi:BirA family biotin operon repressor/biotin-[acetyl-CoA-carboxylase] ligase
VIKQIGHTILKLDEVSSTNDVVKRLSKDDEEHGLVVVAKKQTCGRGRQGKVWESYDESGLWFSILIKPNVSVLEIQTLTLILAVSMVEAIEKVTQIKCGIKWPNDLTYKGKKLCGILCESVFSGNYLQVVVAGIGLNVNQKKFKDELKDIAGSLRMYRNRRVDSDEILQTFITILNPYYNTLVHKGIKTMLPLYKSYSTVIGKRVKLIEQGREVYAVVLDVNDLGNLEILYDDGRLKEVCSGEVTLREVE